LSVHGAAFYCIMPTKLQFYFNYTHSNGIFLSFN
jgi:hypothetical protein